MKHEALKEFEGKQVSVVVKNLARPSGGILQTVGEDYIVGRERLTLGELTRLVTEIGGVRRPWPDLPDWMAMLAAAVLDGLARLTRRPPMWDLSLEAARTLRAGVCADGRKIERDLGLTYTPLRTAIEEAVESLRP